MSSVFKSAGGCSRDGWAMNCVKYGTGSLLMVLSATEKSASSRSSLNKEEPLYEVVHQRDHASLDDLSESRSDNGLLIFLASTDSRLHPSHQRLIVNVEGVEVIMQKVVVWDAVCVGCDAKMQHGWGGWSRLLQVSHTY